MNNNSHTLLIHIEFFVLTLLSLIIAVKYLPVTQSLLDTFLKSSDTLDV